MPKLIPKQYGKMIYDLTVGKEGEELDSAMAVMADFLRKEQVLSKLPYILEEYEMYAKKQSGIVSLHVTSARELSKEMIKTVEQAFGDKTEVTTEIDPALIGGIKIRTEDTLLDGSIQAQLIQLQQQIN
ncbi:ATP synthase F1 subunit delta [Patescibacteria group bacterium]|nr:ATP synthase F1 subunit delta [Patescibacteria group bacterium]MBU1722005.1 ATP synthase F1 subunit delta [Patescibacteria group bacterium]MBU1901245.1 ATP synthase F1 subunit delta [Patescibacteria group bacterium]